MAGGKLVILSSHLPLQRALEETGCSFSVVSYKKPSNNTTLLGFSSKKIRLLFSESHVLRECFTALSDRKLPEVDITGPALSLVCNQQMIKL